jgi:hypothetical protein
MIILDTLTCQPACRGGAGRCLFLQSIYLSNYLFCSLRKQPHLYPPLEGQPSPVPATNRRDLRQGEGNTIDPLSLRKSPSFFHRRPRNEASGYKSGLLPTA